MIELEYPKNWGCTRLKNVALVNKNSLSTSTHSDYILNYLEISNVNNRGIISKNEIRELFFSDAPSRARRIVRNGDTVISSVRPNLQALAYIKHTSENLIASTGFYVVTPLQKLLDEKYTYYLLISDGSRQHLEAAAKGVGYPAVDDKDFVTLKFSIPSLEEQQRIASYLDKTCAAIDKAIEAKQKQLEILDALRKSIITKAVTRGLDKKAKRKDSGHIWIGRIPQEWKVEKLKYVTDLIVDGTHFTPDYIEEGVPFLRVTDIQNSQIDQNKVKRISEEAHRELCKRANPKAGDILLSKNGTIGLIKVVEWNWEFSIFVSLCLIRLRKFLSPYFFRYYFESDVVDQQLFESSKRTSVTNLHLVKIREMRIAFPQLDEQQTIVTFLDTKCAELDKLKENIQQQISTLQQYRKSLIHECVTGKRRVTDDVQD